MKNLTTTSALLVSLAVSAGAQTTYHVPDDFPSITAAVAAASNGDTVLVGPGTYREGDDVQFGGKIIEVKSTHGPQLTIVDGESLYRCFFFTGGETRDTLLEGFTLLDGHAPSGGNTNGVSGGALRVESGSPTIRNCIIRNGRADFGGDGGDPGYRGGRGGGMAIYTGSPLVESCLFEDCRAGRGGMGATGSSGSTGSLFSAPTSGGRGKVGGTGGHGGAVYLSTGSPVFVNCIFRNNEPGMGGTGGTGGRGGNAGGWAGHGGDGGDGGDGGAAGSGAAIYNWNGTPEFVNCSVFSNLSAQRGFGGSGGSGGSSVLGNGSSGDAGSLGPWGSWSLYTTAGAVRNSILWNNFGTGEIPDGNVVTYSCVYLGTNGAGNISSNPALQPSGYLNAGSPCIDAGDNAEVPAAVTLDHNGRPRFVDDHNMPDVGVGTGAIVDMGAIEYARAVVLPYGCGNPADSLSVLDQGYPYTGSTLTLRLDRPDAPHGGGNLLGQPFAARAGLIIGTAPLTSGCGAQLPGGFLQVDLTQPWSIRWGDQPWTGSPIDIDLSIPDDPALTGTSLFVQGAFVRRSPKGELGVGVRLTESLELVLGY